MLVTRNEIVALLKRVHLFNGLTDIQISSLVEKFEALQYSAGHAVFEENALATNFYLIFTGQVALEVNTDQGARRLLLLQTDDYFGEDVLDKEQYRKATARTLKNTILLRINGDELIAFIEKHPQIGPAFSLILENYQNLLKYEATWCKPEEAIRFLARAHPYFLLVKSLVPLLITFAALVLVAILYFETTINVTIIFLVGGLISLGSIIWTVWNAIDWSNDYYLITNQRVVYLEKVVLLYESRQETPLGAILSISKQTSLLGRYFGFGDIAIRTYTGVLNFKHLAQPDQVIGLLSEQWERAKKCLTQEDHEEMEKLLRDRFYSNENEEVKELKEAPFSGQTQVKSGWLLNALAELFGMRTESDGVITYRAHWFMLLGKIIFPSFALAGVFISVLIHGSNFFPFFTLDIFYPLLITLGLAATVWWVYQFLDWRNDLYIITHDQVVDINRKPLGMEDRRAAPIKNIQSIEYKRLGLFGLLFNFGTVFIRIGDIHFTFDYVHNPSEVQREIFERYLVLMKMEKDAQTDRQRRRMADWMDAYHRIMMEQGDTPQENVSGNELE